MPMKNPPHPGGFVLRQCIEPRGLTITQAAAALGVTRTTLSELVNEKRGISPEMAVRLSKVFGGSAATWLTQQAITSLPKSAPTASSSSAWNSRDVASQFAVSATSRHLDRSFPSYKGREAKWRDLLFPTSKLFSASHRSAQKPLRDLAVQIDRLRQLLLLDVLAVGMRHMNRSRTDQQRLAPVGELRDIGCESRNHGRQAIDRAQAQKRQLQRESNFDISSRGLHNLLSQIIRGTNQPVK